MSPILQLSGNRTSQQIDKEYINALSKLAAAEKGLEWFHPTLSSTSASNTRAYYFYGQRYYPQSPEEIIELETRGSRGVFVIENIGPSWIQTLGSAWNLEPGFFLNHARNPPRGREWDNIFNTRSYRSVEDQKLGQYSSLDGVFEYGDWETTTEEDKLLSNHNLMKRQFWKGPEPYPLSSNTRISYYRVKWNTCK